MGLLQTDLQNVNLSMDSFLNNINSILDKCILKFKTKPWITPALQKSISIKNNLLKKFITAKDPQVKERYHKEYKDYKNILSTILKQSKTNYYNHYFATNWNSIKNTWKGFTFIQNIKTISAEIPRTLTVDGTTISNLMKILNIFNNYFSSIATKTRLNISFSHKHFSDFLKNRSNISFFVSPTDKTEIENVISSLDSNKSVGPNSIPTKILKLLKNDIFSQLSEIFNISFSSGVFPSILKTAKVIPVHKKDSKLDFAKYHPISPLSNIEKILERLMYNRMHKFFSDNNLIYSLQFGFRQKYSVHALISLTENIRKNLDEEILAVVFLSTYRKHSIPLNMIFFYQSLNIMVYVVLLMNGLNLISQIENNVSINGYDFNLVDVKFGVPQGSVLDPLLFLIYITDLNQALKFCKVHHFADDTNLIHFSKSVYRLNKYVSLDLKNLTYWLNVNRISLNVKKTELAIF